MIQIPFTTYPCYSQDIKLDGVYYKFLFNWNTRAEVWTLSILSMENVSIIDGIALVPNYNLLKGLHHLTLPKGGLYVLDSTGNKSKIAYGDFTGTRKLKLIYLTEDEVASL